MTTAPPDSATGHPLRYPDFFHIGAYKAASTSLHYYLAQHPDIYMASEKGGNYLAFAGRSQGSDRQFGQGITREEDYRALFSEYAGQPLVGESSPHYLVSDAACQRILAHRPDAKLIVILRNPTESIYARYLMQRRNGSLDVDFTRALDAEEHILATGRGRSRLQLDTAFYNRHLQRYLASFPRNQLLVQLFDDYQTDRDGQLQQLFGFLGVDPGFSPPDTRHYNRSGIPESAWLKFVMKRRRKLPPAVKALLPARARGLLMERMSKRLQRPEMAAADRQRLVALYRDDIQALQQTLGRDLGHWSSTT